MEEAEARMRARNQAHTQANSKIAQLSAMGAVPSREFTAKVKPGSLQGMRVLPVNCSPVPV